MLATVSSPDLLLARRAASGQPEAWDELIALYGKKMYNLAYQFAGSAPEAEDLTQEIFLRLYQNLRLYRGDCPLAAWAMRLSRNLCIDHYRRMRRDRRFESMPDEVLETFPAAGDLVAETEKRQQLAAVYGALSRLPEEVAELVVLRDLQGWSLEEAAAYFDAPLGTIKSRLHRARAELVRLLGERPGVAREEARSC
jgi:RNA polymerase sigma-70 factor (ECF subfamily)